MDLFKELLEIKRRNEGRVHEESFAALVFKFLETMKVGEVITAEHPVPGAPDQEP